MLPPSSSNSPCATFVISCLSNLLTFTFSHLSFPIPSLCYFLARSVSRSTSCVLNTTHSSISNLLQGLFSDHSCPCLCPCSFPSQCVHRHSLPNKLVLVRWRSRVGGGRWGWAWLRHEVVNGFISYTMKLILSQDQTSSLQRRHQLSDHTTKIDTSEAQRSALAVQTESFLPPNPLHSQGLSGGTAQRRDCFSLVSSAFVVNTASFNRLFWQGPQSVPLCVFIPASGAEAGRPSGESYLSKHLQGVTCVHTVLDIGVCLRAIIFLFRGHSLFPSRLRKL